MPKRYLMIMAILLIGLIVALVNMLVHLTQTASVQVVFFQSLYMISDRVWGIGRAVVSLFVAIVASAIAIVFCRELNSKLNSRWVGGILLVSICGLLLGLIVHYAYACCDTPIIYYLGFPVSWLRGVTSSWRSLPTSAISYLIQNLNTMKWHILIWHLLVNVLFWFNVGFILFAMGNRIFRRN